MLLKSITILSAILAVLECLGGNFLLLPLCFGFDSIWWSMPLTELCTCAVAMVLLKKRPVTAEKKEK